MPKPKRIKTPAEIARDEALAKLRAANQKWIDESLERIKLLPSGYEFVSQDMRLKFESIQHYPSTSNLAYGALCQVALRVGLIEQTGRRRKGPIKQCHARTLPIYRRTSQQHYVPPKRKGKKT